MSSVTMKSRPALFFLGITPNSIRLLLFKAQFIGLLKHWCQVVYNSSSIMLQLWGHMVIKQTVRLKKLWDWVLWMLTALPSYRTRILQFLSKTKVHHINLQCLQIWMKLWLPSSILITIKTLSRQSLKWSLNQMKLTIRLAIKHYEQCLLTCVS